MNAHRLFLAFLLQFLLAAPAFAWSFLEDSSQESRVGRCATYQQFPVQSDETKKEEEEEEEPDCE